MAQWRMQPANRPSAPKMPSLANVVQVNVGLAAAGATWIEEREATYELHTKGSTPQYEGSDMNRAIILDDSSELTRHIVANAGAYVVQGCPMAAMKTPACATWGLEHAQRGYVVTARKRR